MDYPTNEKFKLRRNCDQKIQPENTVVSRLAAIVENYRTYWNGVRCSKGHLSPRYTSSGHCIECYKLFRAEEIDQCEISKDPIRKGMTEQQYWEKYKK